MLRFAPRPWSIVPLSIYVDPNKIKAIDEYPIRKNLK